MTSQKKKHGALRSLKTRWEESQAEKERRRIEKELNEFIKSVSDREEAVMKDPAAAYRIIESLKKNGENFPYEFLLECCLRSVEVLAANREDISNEDLMRYTRMIAAYLFKNRNLSSTDELKQRKSDLFRVLKEVEKKTGYRDYLMARYIKEIYPATYNKLRDNPVTNTVIILGKYKAPTPTTAAVGKALEEQGKYTVKYTSLRYRQVPDLEHFEIGLRFIRNLATAHAVVLSEATHIMSHLDIREETKVIQLWHGVGMFKKCGYSRIPEEKRDKLEYKAHRNYTDVTIAAPIQRESFEESMGIPKGSDVIKPIGIARTDVFYDPAYSQGALQKLYDEFPQIRGRKLILYAPTFRGESSNGRGPDKLDIRMMYETLGDDYVLLIKHHGLAKTVPPIPDDLKNVFAFDMRESKILTIEELLAIADICITDYSSVGFEYAITERPLIFFAYDIEEYIDDRGLYFGYDEITPGPVVKTTEEIVDYIANIDERFDPNEIREFKAKYVSGCDGHALERTLELFD